MLIFAFITSEHWEWVTPCTETKQWQQPTGSQAPPQIQASTFGNLFNSLNLNAPIPLNQKQTLQCSGSETALNYVVMPGKEIPPSL